MMEMAKSFEKVNKISPSNQADMYKVSESKIPAWNEAEKTGSDKPAAGSIYAVSDSKEPALNSTKERSDTAKNEALTTRNQDLEGKKHPETGVPFERKTVKDAEGNSKEGVFPQFESKYDAQLPKDLQKESDAKQFKECNGQLKENIEHNPKLAKEFNPEQQEQIKNGDTPDGYTWHHSEETGKMQLVNSETHAQTGHTGGKTVWGGGNENR